MVVGLLGNKSPDSNRFTLVTPKSENDVRLQATLGNQNPTGLPAGAVSYLGFPNYWNTMPMAVFTFLEHFDFTGKEIRPFCTHEGSGMGNSVNDIRKLCPSADVSQGLAIRGGLVKESEKEIKQWLEEIR